MAGLIDHSYFAVVGLIDPEAAYEIHLRKIVDVEEDLGTGTIAGHLDTAAVPD